MKNRFLAIAGWICLYSCQNAATTDNTQDSVTIVTPPSVPLTRDKVNPEPVATYSQKVPDELNDWYFTVKIFETPHTFDYLVKMQYEELRAADTVKIPNFGIPPVVQIQKGKDAFSCVIGFLDKEHRFKPYKQVSAKGSKLNITTLQHYSVATYQAK
jgi:hypothetical protein